MNLPRLRPRIALRHAITTLLLIPALLIGCSTHAVAQDPPLSRIAIGSCARQDRAQHIWQAVIATKPQLFLFIGDNIYGDTQDMSVMRAKYAQLAAQPGYQALLAVCPVLATWDDHDYGVNDGGAEYPKRAESQQAFCDFFNIPPDSPRRSRPGIYDSATFGPPHQRVQIILLDTRYFRSPLLTRSKAEQRAKRLGPYLPDPSPDKTILGPDQWAWLEQTLRQPAHLRIIASSIQVISPDHGWETWGNFPAQRQRLFNLIASTQAAGVIFVSGDRHMTELSRVDDPSLVPYPLHDLTTSGLNQGGGGRPDEPNPHRLLPMFPGANFATITIDWNQPDPVISLRAHNDQGQPQFQHEIKLSTLQPSTTP